MKFLKLVLIASSLTFFASCGHFGGKSCCGKKQCSTKQCDMKKKDCKKKDCKSGQCSTKKKKCCDHKKAS